MEDMIAEQFIGSDKSKGMSNFAGNFSVMFMVIAILFLFIAPVFGLVILLVSIIAFIMSYFNYVDYEYELFKGDITVTKIYKASIRKVACKIEKNNIKNVYREKDSNDNKASKFYNTNIKGLKIYTFELKDNKKVKLALNDEMSKLVDIYYKSNMQLYR